MTHALIAEVAYGPQRNLKAVVRPGQRLVVGSGASDWSLADRSLADQQLALAWDGHTGSLQHLGGDVTTLLDGQPVDVGTIRHGTWIRAGATDITLVGERRSRPEEPPTQAVIAAAAPALVSLCTVADPLYAIVDTSRSRRIRTLLRESPDPMRSLYDGVQADTLAESAPYLVQLDPAGLLLQDLVHEGWGLRWCTFLSAPKSVPFDDVRRHLRKFLMVELESTGEAAYFRYYDPYVLRAYLRGCTPGERRTFVGPLTFLVLDDDGVLHFETA